MGNCLSDVQTTENVGQVGQGTASQLQREADEAVALLSGSMAYSTWVRPRTASALFVDAAASGWTAAGALPAGIPGRPTSFAPVQVEVRLSLKNLKDADTLR